MGQSNMKEIFSSYNIPLSDIQVNQLNQYYELLIDWNSRINLTAITEYDMVVHRHFLDSALLEKCNLYSRVRNEPSARMHAFGECARVKYPTAPLRGIDSEQDGISVLDMGTGAGFPGIVLAILNSSNIFTLVDSLQKRIDFLNVVIQELGLSNVRTFHGRAEDYGRNPEFRNQFDFVVSRAVAELPLLLEYCIPFVKKDGYFVSYKGPKYEEEIQKSEHALQELDARVESVMEFQVEGDKLSSFERRYLLVIQNTEITKQKYPRRAGMPRKKPL